MIVSKKIGEGLGKAWERLGKAGKGPGKGSVKGAAHFFSIQYCNHMREDASTAVASTQHRVATHPDLIACKARACGCIDPINFGLLRLGYSLKPLF